MPDWNQAIRQQLSDLNLPPAREAEIVEELAQHAEDRYRELQSGGATDADARRIALDELGGHQMLASELRAVERTAAPAPVVLGAASQGRFLAGLGQDLRYGFRTLRKSPAFTAIAILALGLGIGANTAIFSVVNGVLLRPLAYSDPGRLLMIYESTADFSQASVSYPNYLDWRRQSHSFDDMGAFRNDDFNFTGSGEPEQISGQYVSASVLPILGVAPFLGRSFLPEEDRQGAACAVMLTYGFWKQRFAEDAKILGRNLSLNAMNCAVVGVLPAGFSLRDKAQIYVPIEQWNSGELRDRKVRAGLVVIGRLKPGVSAKAAQSEISAICDGLGRQYPATNAGHGAVAVPMKEDMVGNIRPTLLLLAGAVGFVLIIACANVANLLLARSSARRREFAIRAALGADRGRVVRQLLTESVLLSLGGAAIGLLLARWGTRLMLAAVPGSLPRSTEIAIDPRVLFFTLAVSVATGLLFGLVPAFHGASVNPQEFLKEGARGAGGARHRAEGVFVVLEVALAVTLLAGAALMMQSVWRLWQVDPGFSARNVLTARVALSPKAMASPAAIRLAFQQMVERVASIPGVQSAAVTSLIPLESDSEIPYWPGTGPQPPQNRMRSAMFSIVTPDYPSVMQIPLRSGRTFTDRDNLASPAVAMIDDVLARRLFPGQNPLGRVLYCGFDSDNPMTIVGVVGDIREYGPATAPGPEIFMPYEQHPLPSTYLTVMVRTSGEPGSLSELLRKKVRERSPEVPVKFTTMEASLAENVATPRFRTLLFLVFAGLAVCLAMAGVYGVMAYVVGQRLNEIGLRMALGASQGDVLRMVLKQGVALAAAGVVLGLAGAVAATRLLTSFLFEVKAGDPLTYLGVAALLATVAMAASYLPARRATKIDPLAALRQE